MNLITLDQLEQGGITDANGNDANGMTNRVRTLYIPISSKISYKVVSASPVVIRYLHFYTANKTWISGTSRSNANPYIFTPPANAAFMRIAFQRATASESITPQDAAQVGKVTLTWDLESAAVAPEISSTEAAINHQGQLINSTALEGYSVAGIRKKGYVYSNEIIEY